MINIRQPTTEKEQTNKTLANFMGRIAEFGLKDKQEEEELFQKDQRYLKEKQEEEERLQQEKQCNLKEKQKEQTRP